MNSGVFYVFLAREHFVRLVTRQKIVNIGKKYSVMPILLKLAFESTEIDKMSAIPEPNFIDFISEFHYKSRHRIKTSKTGLTASAWWSTAVNRLRLRQPLVWLKLVLYAGLIRIHLMTAP